MLETNLITLIKEKNKKDISDCLKSNKLECLNNFSIFLDKRAYTTIDIYSGVTRKKNSLILPLFAFLEDEELLSDFLLNSCDLKEKINIENIERFSSLDIEKVKKNFLKTMFNGNLEFSKKYGKELFLRDRESFFQIVTEFAFLGEFTSYKPLMILSLKRLLSEKFYDGIFYLFISYFTKYRDNIFYRTKLEEDTTLTIEELRNKIKNNTDLAFSNTGLQLLSSLKLLECIEINNKNSILERIAEKIATTKDNQSLNKIEEILIKYF